MIEIYELFEMIDSPKSKLLGLFQQHQHYLDIEGDDHVLLPIWKLPAKDSLSKNEIMDEMGIITRP